MSEVSEMTASIRNLVDDLATSKFIPREDLGKQINGTNKIFFLEKRNIVASSTNVISDGVTLTETTNYTVNVAKGMITIAPATSAPSASLTVDYYWQRFSDAVLLDFINAGLRFIGYGTDATATENDLLGTPESLKEAVEHYALHHVYNALATITADLYKAGAGKKNIDKDGIFKKYQQLAQDNKKGALELRDNYYKRQGRREAPSFAQTHVKYPTYTPIR